MHPQDHDQPPQDDAEQPQGERDGGLTTETGPGVDTGICALCDVVNDLFVAPRAFVQNWRLATEGE
ncbi:MAG: hypothetical protein ACYTGX_19395 [Planctomycetota bacterium]|jgi:hypothetical protein